MKKKTPQPRGRPEANSSIDSYSMMSDPFFSKTTNNMA